MNLTLKNLGKLREATIDLGKDLILLTGPNNTSKTYVAHAIYGFHQQLQVGLARAMGKRLGRGLPSWKASESALFKVDLKQFAEQHLPAIFQEVATDFKEQLSDVFAADRELFADSELKIVSSREDLEFGLNALCANASKEREILIRPNERIVARKAAGESELTFERIVTSLPDLSARAVSTADESDLSVFAYYYVLGQTTGAVLGVSIYSYILAAERAAIQLFSRELSAQRTELIDRLLEISSGGSRQEQVNENLSEVLSKQAKRYPLAIRDGLRIANDLLTYKKETSSWAELADRLESEMLGGTFRIEESGEMLFHPSSLKRGLGLHLASSSVKSLAGLTFFLRHIAKKGHFLIIDEPELNLHPDNQRRVARLLGRLAQSGMKVLISTHSDYIIREINNLIMLSHDEEGNVRQRLGYSQEEILHPHQVGAYLFDAERARPIEVQPTGIEVKTIDREINALNEVSQDIYFALLGKNSAL